jgi:hypothetical protein
MLNSSCLVAWPTAELTAVRRMLAVVNSSWPAVCGLKAPTKGLNSQCSRRRRVGAETMATNVILLVCGRFSGTRGCLKAARVVTVLTSLLAQSTAEAYPISSVFTVDPATSSLSVTASAYGFSDTDSNNLSGSMNGTLDLGTSGNFPGAGTFTISSGTIIPDGNYSLRLGFPPFLGVNIVASGLAASVSTLEPPGTITRATASGVVYNLNASELLVSLNQGTIVVSGSTNETTDLSEEPVDGSAPEGALGSLTFTTVGTSGMYTRVNALLTLPIDIETTTDLEGGNGEVAATGTLNATSSFYVALSGIPGDFQLDGDVDDADLAIWRNGFGIASGATTSNGDANSDGQVSGADFLIWQRNRGIQPPETANRPATAPEPATLGACLLALAAVAVTRRHSLANG